LQNFHRLGVLGEGGIGKVFRVKKGEEEFVLKQIRVEGGYGRLDFPSTHINGKQSLCPGRGIEGMTYNERKCLPLEIVSDISDDQYCSIDQFQFPIYAFTRSALDYRSSVQIYNTVVFIIYH
jgi:hypothetical protein